MKKKLKKTAIPVFLVAIVVFILNNGNWSVKSIGAVEEEVRYDDYITADLSHYCFND